MAVNGIKLQDRTLATHKFVLPSDVFVMLPVPGDGERKVVVLCFTSVFLRQFAAS